jgi:quinolinate synthase
MYMKNLMPDMYREMTEDELVSRIEKVKKELGPELFILTHHYQREGVMVFGDAGGDSFALSKKAAENDKAKYIVFCGVHFMAESAAILARGEQAVFIPEMSAGCPMADMAPVEDVERAWREIGEVVDTKSVTPVTYVNSNAAVKAFCGGRRGATCTSSNADKLFSWAFKQSDKIFFIPDEHLGRNSAHKLSVGPVALWDPAKPGGGLSEDEIKEARVIVWKGFCHVHTAFTIEQIEEKRKERPGCTVIVHPECRRKVVEAADASGSTEGIINYVAEQPKGAVIAVGTEINLVRRLARQYEGEKTVVPLARSLCPNMYRINQNNLCWVLESIGQGPGKWANRVTVPDEVKKDAALALRRMLDKA